MTSLKQRWRSTAQLCSTMPIDSRYEEFQRQAVLALVSDFKETPAGRFLLVIPTGGGKTFTAVKAITRMFDEGVLKSGQDRVLWIAHRTELVDQAREAFVKFESFYPERTSYKSSVQVEMIARADQELAHDAAIKLIVIDEAHHSAANSYQPFFADVSRGVLGLTATPSRHDGRALEFDRESYSIGFPDLVEYGAILSPVVRKIDGGESSIISLDDNAELEKLNNDARSKKIIAALLKDVADYKKVLIYVGTNRHAEDLCKQLAQSPLNDHYQSIACITGAGNSRNESRDAFMQREKSWARSILVNVGILTEGYDDPKVNAVMLATPTRSKLTYMQVVGRAIRRDPNNELKTAYVIEVEDTLPNIRYRIDNRWLYSDISDALEPVVLDREYTSVVEFSSEVLALFQEFPVAEEDHVVPAVDSRNRYSLLMFKYYKGNNHYGYQPVWLDNSNRVQVRNVYDYLSARMPRFVAESINRQQAIDMARARAVTALAPERTQKRMYEAMYNAYTRPGEGWITFVSFKHKRSALSDELERFLSPLVNRDDVRRRILNLEYPSGGYVLRLPLPLAGLVGQLVSEAEHVAVKTVIDALEAVRTSAGDVDHRRQVRDLIDAQVLPIEVGHLQSLSTIVRESIPYAMPLST